MSLTRPLRLALGRAVKLMRKEMQRYAVYVDMARVFGVTGAAAQNAAKKRAQLQGDIEIIQKELQKG